MYSITAWFAARTATTWPVEILQTALFCVVMYWMVGYYASFLAFLIFTAAFCLFQLTSETIGTVCAIVTGTSTYAVLVSAQLPCLLVWEAVLRLERWAAATQRVARHGVQPAGGAVSACSPPTAPLALHSPSPRQILTFVLLFLLSFSGFLVSDVPMYFSWISTISYLTYAYAAGERARQRAGRGRGRRGFPRGEQALRAQHHHTVLSPSPRCPAVIENEFTRTTFYTTNGTAVPGSAIYNSELPGELSPLSQVRRAQASGGGCSMGRGACPSRRLAWRRDTIMCIFRLPPTQQDPHPSTPLPPRPARRSTMGCQSAPTWRCCWASRWRPAPCASRPFCSCTS